MATFKEHQTMLFRGLECRGWTISSPMLKVRHATKCFGDQQIRLWFKDQSIYFTQVGGWGKAGRHEMSNARPLSYESSKQWSDAQALEGAAVRETERS